MTPLLEFRCCYLLRLWRYLTSMQHTHRYLSPGILALDQVSHLNSALLQAVGGHKGTLLREWSESMHWAWSIAQLLSLTPMVPDCSRVSPIHALLAVRQFFSPSPCPLDRLPLAWDKLFFLFFPFTLPDLEHPTLPLPTMDSWVPSSRNFCAPDCSWQSPAHCHKIIWHPQPQVPQPSFFLSLIQPVLSFT